MYRTQLGADALAVDLEHLGCRVDRGQPARAGDQPPRPEAGSAGQFENLAAGSEVVERALERGDLLKPPPVRLGTVVVATLTQPPAVVLAGASAVVSLLLVEELDFVHGRSPS